MESSTSAIIMDTFSGQEGAGASGVRTAINKMIIGFIPYHDHPYFKWVLLGIAGVIVLWILLWFWFNFIR